MFKNTLKLSLLKRSLLHRNLSQTSKNWQSQSTALSQLDYNQSVATYANSLGHENGTKYDTVINTANNEVIPLSNKSSLKDVLSATGSSSIKLKSSDSNSEVLVVFPRMPEEDKLRILAAELVNSLGDLSTSNRLNEIDNKISAIDEKLQPLEDKYAQIVKTADEKTDNNLVLFLGINTVTFFSIARLTWWEYSWDIMEPVAWAAQAGGMLFWGWYYFITRSENSMTDISNRIHNKKFRKRLEAESFSIGEYNDLIMTRKKLEKDYLKIKEMSLK